MAEKVEKLKNLVAKAENRCEIHEVSIRKKVDKRFVYSQSETKIVMPSKKMTKDTECLLMALSGPSFTEKLKKIHIERLKNEKC